MAGRGVSMWGVVRERARQAPSWWRTTRGLTIVWQGCTARRRGLTILGTGSSFDGPGVGAGTHPSWQSPGGSVLYAFFPRVVSDMFTAVLFFLFV